MTKVTITTSSEGGGFIVRFCGGKPYVFRALVGSLKDIPRERRSYDPANKQWNVCDQASLNDWAEFAKTWGAMVEWDKVEWDGDVCQPPRPGKMIRANAFVALHLLPTAPPELVKAAHKVLSLIYHPDRGGDLETMQIVNAAFDLLKT